MTDICDMSRCRDVAALRWLGSELCRRHWLEVCRLTDDMDAHGVEYAGLDDVQRFRRDRPPDIRPPREAAEIGD